MFKILFTVEAVMFMYTPLFIIIIPSQGTIIIYVCLLINSIDSADTVTQ